MESEPTLRTRPARIPGLVALATGVALSGCGLLDSPATTLIPRSDFGLISHRIFLQILRWDTVIFLAGTCVGCHTVQGVSAGVIGPDLTHFGSRKTIAGGMLPNTPENLARWVHHAPAVKPGSIMPDQKLSDTEVAAVVAYLESLQ